MAKTKESRYRVDLAGPLPASGNLYKYRSLKEGPDRANTLAIITGNQMWWGRGSSFNDPFDCSHYIRYERSREELEALASGMLNKGLTALDNLLAAGRARLLGQGEAAASAETRSGHWTFTAEDKQGNPVDLAELINRSQGKALRKTLDRIDAAVGVLCLSQEPDNILLWSHYANSHDGICLRFDVAGHRAAFPRLRPVNYQRLALDLEAPLQYLFDLFKRQPRLLLDLVALMADSNPEEDYPLRQLERWFYTKSRDWAYECEWRAMTTPPGLARFPARALTGIIVGCVNTEANLALIRAAIRRKRPRPRLYVASKKRDAFGLDIEPAD